MTKLSMLVGQHVECLKGFREFAMARPGDVLYDMQNASMARLLAAARTIEGRAEQMENENEYLRGLLKERVDTTPAELANGKPQPPVWTKSLS